MHILLYRVERACNKEVNYDGVQIKKGVIVTVSAFALHYDEEYYPDPYRFNPDRYMQLIIIHILMYFNSFLLCIYTQQMGSGKWNQTESKCFHAVRDGTSQLRRDAIRHGGNENRPVYHRQTFPFLSRQGDTRNKFWIHLFNIKLLLLCHLILYRRKCSLRMDF